jgi:hypothetical protein
MKQITPGTVPVESPVQAVPTILGQVPSVMSKITRTSSNEFSQSAVRDASPGDGTPAMVGLRSSLQRSNIAFFLRSIAKSPRPK